MTPARGDRESQLKGLQRRRLRSPRWMVISKIVWGEKSGEVYGSGRVLFDPDKVVALRAQHQKGMYLYSWLTAGGRA